MERYIIVHVIDGERRYYAGADTGSKWARDGWADNPFVARWFRSQAQAESHRIRYTTEGAAVIPLREAWSRAHEAQS